MLAGKKALIVGLMSDRSIAYGVSDRLFAQGCKLGFSSMERFTERVTKLTEAWSPFMMHPCDVMSDDDIESLAKKVCDTVGKIDILVHSVAFAPRDHLEGTILSNLTREGISQAHEVSSHSLPLLTKALLPCINDNGSIITMTYLGASRVVPNYNVMGAAKASLEASVRYLACACGDRGIRVNAISAGPIRTPAASGIRDLRTMIDYVGSKSPIAKPITAEQVGDVCAFLSSDMASSITGSVIYADHGYHIMGIS
ncbi:MAG: enoyl-ACP reductase [Pseudomonadota bacterium]|nr:enoyl-ACP reductase [Pseudomonadota bacterium]